ncbi:DUF3047 domain-containing protein [Halomonas organivorans]|uniref:DUF3047 domain-containing protein n=1 Tax=Halomonas organivorans TaxID=257772 RepID=A0A7W5C106_9GAMM|nr:DUF3047 domain-containing protein [Halomonas organivorans]MBB3141838.1 hypothetical protein [Halomonas organivorans]
MSSAKPNHDQDRRQRRPPRLLAMLGLAMLVLATLGLAIAPLAMAASQGFPPATMLDWPERSFAGHTEYRLATLDGETVLAARARGQASAKYLERDIELAATPYLKWCWRVSGLYPGLDERTRAGDDYPARVYVVRRTGLLPWQVQSVNYVWSSTQAAGTDWPNAFTDRAHLLALQGGPGRVGEWVAEVRDVRDDYRRLFGERPGRLAGLALMTDGDNAGGDATAWFTALTLSSDATPPRCPR